MAHNKQHKRVNLTLQQLVEKERQKSEQREMESIRKQCIEIEEARLATAPAPESKQIGGAEKAVTCPAPLKRKKSSKTDSILITVSELCTLLGLSRSSVSRMERDEAIPGRVKLGGSVRYHRETVEEWIREMVK